MKASISPLDIPARLNPLWIKEEVFLAAGIVARLRSLRLQQGRQSSRRIGQHFPCMAGSNATASRPSSSEVVMAHWLTNGRGLASGIADGWDAVKTASLASAGTDYKHRINASNTSTAAIPRAPPEWQPPTDPSGPRAPPEFTPPRDPGLSAGFSLPAFTFAPFRTGY